MKINDLQNGLPKPQKTISDYKLVYNFIYNYLDDRTMAPIPVLTYFVNRKYKDLEELDTFEIGLGDGFPPGYTFLLTDTHQYVLVIDQDYYLIDRERNILAHANSNELKDLGPGNAVAQMFIQVTAEKGAEDHDTSSHR